MAIANIQPMKAAKTVGGYDIPMDSSNPEAATQTFNAGAVLILSSGNVTEATGAGGTGTSQAIYGISQNGGQNLGSAGFYSGGSTVSGIYVPVTGAPNQGPMVALALPNVVFEANLASTTAGDPDQATSLLQSQVGSTYAVSKGTTSKLWYLDATAGGNKRAVVVGLKDAVGTVSGRVYFMFLLTSGDTIYA